MRVSKQRSAENRERIVVAAARLFRERGLTGVGVDALASEAGLSHGSLYSQFGSKEGLMAEAIGHGLTRSSERLSDAASLEDYVRRYLSPEHRDRPGDGCVMAALGGEMPRQSAPIRRRFTDAVHAAMHRIAGLRPGRGRERERDGDDALAVLSTLVGALSLARAVDDPELSARILAAARKRLMAG